MNALGGWEHLINFGIFLIECVAISLMWGVAGRTGRRITNRIRQHRRT